VHNKQTVATTQLTMADTNTQSKSPAIGNSKVPQVKFLHKFYLVTEVGQRIYSSLVPCLLGFQWWQQINTQPPSQPNAHTSTNTTLAAAALRLLSSHATKQSFTTTVQRDSAACTPQVKFLHWFDPHGEISQRISKEFILGALHSFTPP
jgi:hypothetical protein